MNPAVREQLLAAGLANQRRGDLAQAEHCYRLVLTRHPRDADALYRMGVLALQCANAKGALHYLEQVRSVRALDADGWYNLGMAHALDYELDAAKEAFERARSLDPAHPSAAVSLGNVHKLMGRAKEAGEAYLAAVSSPRIDAVLFSQLLVGLHTNPTIDASTLFELHREWARRYSAALYPRSPRFSNAPDPHKRLTIGFVSPKLTSDIVGHFLRGMVRPLADEAKLFFYHAGGHTDWVTAELAAANASWRDIATMDDATAAALIARDGIDVLVDLAGHAPNHRLLVFARKPAPVQVTWLDYFDTTGLDTIDVLITDRVSTPPSLVARGAQRFVESLAYLPHSRLCFSPPPYAPPVAALPALTNGHITFGCFGRADKVVPEVVALWAQVLASVPGSRLVLKSGGLGIAPVRERIASQFEAHGVARDRIGFRGASTHETLLHEYGEIDIALDTFPYNGGATTCDALWMGVPVITLEGEGMIARQGASLLTAAGRAEWIAADAAAFVSVTSELASDVARLGALRGELRTEVSRSSLCDGAAFAGDFLEVIAAAWRGWCAGVADGAARTQVAARPR